MGIKCHPQIIQARLKAEPSHINAFCVFGKYENNTLLQRCRSVDLNFE